VQSTEREGGNAGAAGGGGGQADGGMKN